VFIKERMKQLKKIFPFLLHCDDEKEVGETRLQGENGDTSWRWDISFDNHSTFSNGEFV